MELSKEERERLNELRLEQARKALLKRPKKPRDPDPSHGPTHRKIRHRREPERPSSWSEELKQFLTDP
jgi:hypothetical protein